MSVFGRALRAFAPSYMRGPVGGILLDACGRAYDAMAQRFADGRTASSVGDCAPEVMPYHARDRTIRLYPTEPLASRRVRLANWHQLHGQRAIHEGELRHLHPYFLPGTLPTLRIVHQAGDGSSATWHSLNPDGEYEVFRAIPSNWDWDGVDYKWSRFWLIIEVEGTSIDAGQTNWDDPNWDDGHLWGGLPSEAQIADFLEIIRDWQGPESVLWGVLLVLPGHSLYPDAVSSILADGSTTYPVGNWWSYIDATTGKPTRAPYIRTIYNRGHG